jgi:hypothetical protein
MRVILVSLGLLLGAVVLLAGCGHSSPPAPPTVGSTVAMGQGKDAVNVKVTGVATSRRVNFLDKGLQFHTGVNAPAGETFIVVALRFTGVGSNGYTAYVPQWSWLGIKAGGAASTVRASGRGKPDPYTDMQTTTILFPEARLEVEGHDVKRWKVAFLVPDGAQPVSFTYQGPDNQRATWTL